MEKYPWFTERQKQLTDEVVEFVDEITPRAYEAAIKQEHPRDLVKMVADKGWFGALVPEEYGGMGKEIAVTGCQIIAEGLTRAATVGGVYSATSFGGVEQICMFGTDEQKERWLPKIARGELLGAITLTEPFVGTDAAGIRTTATRDGDYYLLNGKKRFISNAGLADIYMLYAKTSDEPGDRAAYKHLSAFIVEKGTPGFTIERINELAVFRGIRNGFLDFDNARVPASNMLLGEGNGWGVLTAGLNFERLTVATQIIAGMREALRYALYFSTRRVQFNRRTIDFEANQYKLADIILRMKTARLLTYYAAWMMDQGLNPVVEANAAKIYATEACRDATLDALQIIGGDAFTKFYPVEQILLDAKILEVGAGTNEVLRRLLTAQARRIMADELKAPRRRVHKELRFPIPYYKASPEFAPKKVPTDLEGMKNTILEALAADYFVNPGLHMKREELVEDTGLDEEQLDETLVSLEERKLVDLYRTRQGVIILAKATYDGLRKAKPKEYYQWYPEWSKEDERF
ncbi:MAG: acyl-CoA dehydrogenase family protein [Candidatus Lokiarchaeia archaeon]